MKIFKKISEGEDTRGCLIAYNFDRSWHRWFGIVIPLSWKYRKNHTCMDLDLLGDSFECKKKVRLRLGIKIVLPQFIFTELH